MRSVARRTQERRLVKDETYHLQMGTITMRVRPKDSIHDAYWNKNLFEHRNPSSYIC
jgi:hypothetical protein